MNEPSTTDTGETTDRSGLIGLLVTVASIALTLLFYVLGWYIWEVTGWKIAFYGSAVVLISVVIWQACDPFADAAQWIGEQFHVPGSVRGATLDAVASSLPELFTGIFFVVIAAITATEADIAQKSGEGYGATVATCAGSAVYNMILIPAFVALVISFARPKRPTVDVEDKVIARDGVAFLLCEVMLLTFLFMEELHWWMGLFFIAAYLIYILLLYTDWKRFEMIKKSLLSAGLDSSDEQIRDSLADQGKAFSLAAIRQARNEVQRLADDDEGVEDDGEAGVLFGFFSVTLSRFSAWATIVVATLITAVACFFLVEVTLHLADLLGVAPFFVAVIVAAAASSVPDTFISIGAALRGDDSGAVSNAFGSNIFDICICLAVPLIIMCGLNDWQSISLLQENGEPMAGLVGLRILLGVLTVITLAIMWHNRQLTRNKALVLCALYGIFIAYAVLGSLEIFRF